MVVEIGNFYFKQDSKGEWIFKSKDYIPKTFKKKEVVKEPIDSRHLEQVEEEFKSNYNKILVTTVKEIIKYINNLEDV